MEPRFTVSKFNELINSTLSSIGDVAVIGEITQMNITQKGGVNIVIKDEKDSSILNITGYKPRIEGIEIINEGMVVVAFGIPTLWSMGGKFSLSIYKIMPLGAGALREAYEKLKLKLDSEGLFDLARKRDLPEFVTRIALLTGKDSAAQSDFLKIVQENKIGVSIDIFNVLVQGKYAEEDIINALRYSDTLNYDAIFLVRGGGSLEDLITFNSEKVARTIFAMKIPVVVGVGHEKDESIADFVADIRASTPSQAAYYLYLHNKKYLDLQILKCEYIKNQLSLINKKNYILVKTIHERIINIIILKLNILKNILDRSKLILIRFSDNIKNIFNRIENILRLLISYDPKKALKRGYSLVKSNGKIIKDPREVNIGSNIDIELYKGRINSKVLEINN